MTTELWISKYKANNNYREICLNMFEINIKFLISYTSFVYIYIKKKHKSYERKAVGFPPSIIGL